MREPPASANTLGLNPFRRNIGRFLNDRGSGLTNGMLGIAGPA
jgi:hypothetical protein